MFCSIVHVDGLHEQFLDLRQGEGFFRKGVELGFTQHLCERCYALHCGPTGDKPVRPFSAVALFIVATAVFKLLFVPELVELALIGGDLGFQLRNGFLFWHGSWHRFVKKNTSAM